MAWTVTYMLTLIVVHPPWFNMDHKLEAFIIRFVVKHAWQGHFSSLLLAPAPQAVTLRYPMGNPVFVVALRSHSFTLLRHLVTAERVGVPIPWKRMEKVGTAA